MRTFLRVSIITTLTIALVGGTIWTLFAKRGHTRQQAEQALQTVAPSVETIVVEAHTVE